ncbi:hypothetical protein LINPERHAP1_LOCUS22741 [Linum perenne]
MVKFFNPWKSYREDGEDRLHHSNSRTR